MRGVIHDWHVKCVFVYSIKHLYVKIINIYVIVAGAGQVPVLSFPCVVWSTLPKVGGHFVAALFNVYKNLNFSHKVYSYDLYGFHHK